MPKPLPDFDLYPDNLLVQPQSDPARLLALIQAHGGMDTEVAITAAHACLAGKNWGHLRALAAAGFDIAANHGLGFGDARVEETLLHRCLRLHLYDELSERLETLLGMGANPHAFNLQGVSVLGLLAHQSRDLPPHRTREAFAALEAAGVRMSDACSNGLGMSRFLLDSNHAVDIIATRCPELVGWARACVEQEQMRDATGPLPAAPSAKAPRL